MASKSSGNSKAGSPIMTGDFRLIRGIGPVFSQRLHNAGIFTYVQLASLSPAELSEVVGGLSVKYISRQDWVGQARKLALKKERYKRPKKEISKQSIRQHYENFTIEFLLDEKKIIRRTHLVHIQSGDSDTWAGWEADQLICFIARHAGIHFPPIRLENPEYLTVYKQNPGNSCIGSGPMEANELDQLPQFSDIRKISQPGTEIAKPVIHSPVKNNFAGMIRLQNFRVLTIGSDSPVCSLRQEQQYHIELTLDIANVDVPIDIPLSYKATISFKHLTGASYLVAEESSPLKLSDCVRLDIICANLPSGLYRPNALVRLFSGEIDLGLMASIKGDLIQVF